MSLDAFLIVATWRLEARLKGVAYEIADHHNAATGQCNPSRRTLALGLNCTIRQIQYAIQELTDIGLLTTDRVFREGRQTTNAYHIVLPGGEQAFPPPNGGGEQAFSLGGEPAFSQGGEQAFSQNQEEGIRNRNQDYSPRSSARVPPPKAAPPQAPPAHQNAAKEQSTVSTSPKAEPCPYDAIRSLWLKYCPTLTVPLDVEDWTAARKAIVRARWKDQLPDLETWEVMLREVAKSKFLSGQVQPAPGRQPFKADLFWICKPENLSKLAEGKYA